MTRTRQVPAAEAAESVLPIYQRLFGDRDPVAQPGTATGTPGNWWAVFAQTPELSLFLLPCSCCPARCRSQGVGGSLALARRPGALSGGASTAPQHGWLGARAGSYPARGPGNRTVREF